MKFQIFSSFDVRRLEGPLTYWLERLGFSPEISAAPAYQLLQQLLGAPLQGAAGVEIALVDGELWRVAAQEIHDALDHRVQKSARPMIGCVCPPFLANAPAPGGLTHWLDPESFCSLYQVTPNSCKRDDEGLSLEFMAALATALARQVRVLFSKPIKMIVADGDQTLWDGVLGEDGADAIQISPPRAALQSALKKAGNLGQLLGICSKNRLEDVRSVFDTHPQMVLRSEDVSSWKVGWGSKAIAVLEMARELGLSLDSFLILDDNPVEVAELRAGVPSALTLLVPPLEDLTSWLAHLWILDTPPATLEDTRRQQMYREQAQRREALAQAPDLVSFHSTLDLKVRCRPLQAAEFERASQLTHRTSQMHLAPTARLSSELQHFSQQPDCQVTGVEVRDRFGDYGLVGVMAYRQCAQSLDVETFLLSCRALGRGVETRMLNFLGEQSASEIRLRFTETARNLPAQLFLRSLVGRDVLPEVVSVTSETARAAVWEIAGHTAAPVTAPSSSTGSDNLYVLEEIAREAWTADALVRHLEDSRRRPRSATTPFRAPETARELQIAEVWSQVLGVFPVGADDGFFELGGDSLGMVSVLARLRDKMTDVPGLDQFLRSPTVRELAAPSPSPSHPEPDNLAFVSELSDEEVERMLAELESGVRIEAIAIPTAGRPVQLAQTVEGFGKYLRRWEREARFAIVDNSNPDDTTIARSRLASLVREQGLEIDYLGQLECQAFQARLVAAGWDPETVAFGLNGGVGANYNALQILLEDVVFFSPDDDTSPDEMRSGDLESELRATCGEEAEEFWEIDDPDGPARASLDFLAYHESLLGPTPWLSTNDPRLQARLAADESRVAMTFNGLVGDCGWGSPFGYWEAPMGYLWMNEASQSRLIKDPDTYARVCQQRNHIRMAPNLALSDGVNTLGTFFALDNRGFLPPWFPAKFRGSDRIYPCLLALCDPGVLFGNVPVALAHTPHPPRRFWSGEIFRSSAGVDMARVLIELLHSWPGGGSHRTPQVNLQSIGRHFIALGSLPLADFGEVVRARLTASNDGFQARALSRMERGPGHWRADLASYLDRVQAAQKTKDYWIPLDVRPTPENPDAAATTRKLVHGFGRFLETWPEFVKSARSEAARRPVWSRL